ncbi:MAG: ThiF family adenylyltransferase [Planctomycetota bacterium]
MRAAAPVCRVTVTVTELARIRRELLESPGRVIELPAGIHRDAQGLEVFAPRGGSNALPAAILRFAALPRSLEGISHHWWEGFDVPRGPRPRVDVFLHEERGCSAALLCDGAVHPIAELLIAGPRMDRWIPARTPPDLIGVVPADGPFSRYIGALGGDGVHTRMRALSIAFVGAARLASLAAIGCARAGVRRITLIDADLIEEHSRDAVEVLASDRSGRPKVEVVARMIAAVAPEVEVVPLCLGVEDPAAADACAHADLVISAPDQNQARLVAALYATAHLRPHLDLGTGVFGTGDDFVAGADIRLTVPGDGCLLCVGSLDLQRRHERDWRRQRAGSLRSLNGLAVSHALFLLERFLCGDVAQSTWFQLVLDRRAELVARRMPRERDPGCPLCALSGCGDDAAGKHPFASRTPAAGTAGHPQPRV